MSFLTSFLTGRRAADLLNRMNPMMVSLLRQLDRVVSETAGCDTYIAKFSNALEKLIMA